MALDTKGATEMQWFDVSKKGLAKLLEDRGFAFIVYELIQNALFVTISYTIDITQ